MGIIPCEIPLLEFDPEQTAVIGPDYEQLDLHLPRKCVFAFLGAYIDRCGSQTGRHLQQRHQALPHLCHHLPRAGGRPLSGPGGGRRSGPAAGLAHQLRGP